MLARLFKFHRQYIIPNIFSKLPIERISYKTEYSENKRTYDTLLKILEKYDIDKEMFISFCVSKMRIREAKKLLDVLNFREYATELQISKQLEFVYRDFLRSAKNIAERCVDSDISTSEYIANLIQNNTLGYEYYTGTVSKYYLAGIQNFKELYNKLDYLNKEELSIIYEATDQLKDTLRESFKSQNKKFVAPITLTDSIITAIKDKNNNTNKENKSCVH